MAGQLRLSPVVDGMAKSSERLAQPSQFGLAASALAQVPFSFHARLAEHAFIDLTR
jgi:hypothetical protein